MVAKVAVCVWMGTSGTYSMSLLTGLIRAVGITPANVRRPPAWLKLSVKIWLEPSASLTELHIDRAYLSSHLVRERSDSLEIYCKAWPVRKGKRFHKQAFTLDWKRQVIQCPAKQEMSFMPGGVVHFPKEVCDQCPMPRPMYHQCQGMQREHPFR